MMNEVKHYPKVQQYIESSKTDSKLAIIVADANNKYPYHYGEQLKYIEETLDPGLAAKRAKDEKETWASINNLIAQKQLEAIESAKTKPSTSSHKSNFMAEYAIKKHLKKRLTDPDSLQDLKCEYQLTRDNGVQVFECTYRAKNVMGGYQRAVEEHWFDSNGTLLETGGFK